MTEGPRSSIPYKFSKTGAEQPTQSRVSVFPASSTKKETPGQVSNENWRNQTGRKLRVSLQLAVEAQSILLASRIEDLSTLCTVTVACRIARPFSESSTYQRESKTQQQVQD
jgi:hypothetical protein